MRKMIVSLVGVLLLCMISGFNMQAKAAKNEAEYDMTQGGTQQFTILDDDLEEVVITVEEEPTLSKAVKNGTYNITSEKAGQWKASYQIVVSSNAITKAINPSATAYIGSFTSKNLVLETSKQATYYLTRKQGYLESKLKVRATLNTSSITITN